MVEAALKGSFWRNSQHTRVQPFHSQMYKFSTTNLQEWCHKLTSCIEYNPRFFFKHSGPRFHIMSPYCGDSMQTVLYKNFPSFLQVKIQYFTFILGKVMAVSLIRKNKSLKTNLQYEPTWTKLFCFLNTTVTVLHMFILHLRCLERKFDITLKQGPSAKSNPCLKTPSETC